IDTSESIKITYVTACTIQIKCLVPPVDLIDNNRNRNGHDGSLVCVNLQIPIYKFKSFFNTVDATSRKSCFILWNPNPVIFYRNYISIICLLEINITRISVTMFYDISY